MHNDIPTYRNYANFLKKAELEGPYQKTTNVYPLGRRKYSTKHFRIQDNGEIHIYYANRETTDEMVAKGEQVSTRHIATVFPDNSIRLENKTWMSDYTLVGQVTGFNCRNESRRGGLIISGGEGFHPGYQGLRVMLNSGAPHPESLYEVHSLTLKRKAATEYMKQYDDFLNTFPVMLRAMGSDAVREMIVEMRDIMRKNIEPVKVLQLIHDKHYCDAAVAFGLYKSTMGPWLFGASRNIDGLIANTIAQFRHFALSNANPEEVFSITKHAAGSTFPTSVWPLRVYLNNQPMKRI